MKTLLLVTAAFAFNSYAGLTDLVRNQLCNKNGSFEHGMNDGRGGKPMNSGFAHICEASVREEIEKNYRDGYMTGVQSQNNNAKTEINVNVATNGSTDAGKRVYCELKPFTKTFSAWGGSELEAKINVQSECMKQYDKILCEDYDCKKAE